MLFSPYEKSRIINYAQDTTSFKESEVNRLRAEYAQNMSRSLEYESGALINGEPRQIIATKTKGNQRYQIISYPGETFYAGDIVECYDSHWIIVEVESNKDIYTTGVMLRCNHLFRFQNGTSEIIERWGVLDTGVYSTTVKDTETMTELNKQYKIYLPLDDATRNLYIGKRLATSTMKNSNYEDVLVCWRTTEFDSLSENYGSDALLIMKCISDQYNPQTDSIEEMICDFISSEEPPVVVYELNASISHTGDPIVRAGGSGKTFMVSYTDSSGEPVADVVTTWRLGLKTPPGITIEPNGAACRVVAAEGVEDGTTFNLNVEGALATLVATSSIEVEVIGL